MLTTAVAIAALGSGYQSQVLFEPHIVLEIFFFDEAVGDGNGADPTDVELAG